MEKTQNREKNFDIRMTTIVMIMKIVLEKMHTGPCWWVVPRQMTNSLVKRVASDTSTSKKMLTAPKRQGGDSDVGLH